ncbi:MAG TPA: exodeoxyribonuclease III [Archangium sp.]|nr:exodeoxyribonuclease III [Archangium sp.]
MRIVSWNVNGLRAAHKKGFLQWLAAEQADVVGVQEVRALVEQLPEEVRSPEGWRATHFVPAECRLGYSGVGLYMRKAPDDVETRLGVKEMDAEGRLQVARFGRLTVVNCYFPNGNGKERDNSRVPFKLAFYRRLFKRLEKGLRDGERILVMGDFNTAHQEIDLARPKDNRETSGFLPEEREEFDRWIRAGWVDTFRHFEKGPGHYSWWSQRFGVRERNVGWRLDYVLASPGAMPYVKRAGIQCTVLGSDHCPVSVDLDPKVRR